ncbi:MAG: zinc metalloprotease HtpX [Actinomycetota bacterium]|nr:zinc metalloprotease HtpX [Actinomycetota bacterium]
MPKSRFPADHGLSARMGVTVFLIGLLYALFVTGLVLLRVSVVLIVVIAFGILAAQYWLSDKIALFAMHAQEVTPEQAPQLHAIVDRLCALADMPKPRVAIAQTDMPNAFATGRNPQHAVVCATAGILRRLDEPEIEAVLAHELSHVAHRDVAVMTIASFLGILAGLMTRFVLYAGLFGGFGDDREGNQTAMFELAVLAFSALVYAISFMLTRALSRYRELAADRSGAILIGKPSLLASALVKITGDMARIPTRDLRSAETFNAFFFTPALSQGISLSSIFSTHPSLERRLAQLSKLEAEMNKP